MFRCCWWYFQIFTVVVVAVVESVDCILLEITGQVTKHAAGVPLLIIKIVIIAPELTAVSHQHYLWYLSPPLPPPHSSARVNS